MDRDSVHITTETEFRYQLKNVYPNSTQITWPEILSEGETLSNINSREFWKKRYQFHKTYFKIQKKDFINNTLKEYRRLCKFKSTASIFLWTDKTLVSQINMIGVLSWLKDNCKDSNIYLVEKPQKINSIKSYNQNSISIKTKLNQDDIEFADYVWQSYCSSNPIHLENIINFHNYNFKYLQKAINTHLKRFPSVKNGLNEIENRILQKSTSRRINSKEELIMTIKNQDKNYGYTINQFQRIFESLKLFYTTDHPLKLNQVGMQILSNKTNCYGMFRNNNSYLGGSLKFNYLYNYENKKILKL